MRERQYLQALHGADLVELDDNDETDDDSAPTTSSAIKAPRAAASTTTPIVLAIDDEHRTDILGQRGVFSFREGEGAAGSGTAGDATIRAAVERDEEALMALLAECDEALGAGEFATCQVSLNDVAVC